MPRLFKQDTHKGCLLCHYKSKKCKLESCLPCHDHHPPCLSIVILVEGDTVVTSLPVQSRGGQNQDERPQNLSPFRTKVPSPCSGTMFVLVNKHVSIPGTQVLMMPHHCPCQWAGSSWGLSGQPERTGLEQRVRAGNEAAARA